MQTVPFNKHGDRILPQKVLKKLIYKHWRSSNKASAGLHTGLAIMGLLAGYIITLFGLVGFFTISGKSLLALSFFAIGLSLVFFLHIYALPRLMGKKKWDEPQLVVYQNGLQLWKKYFPWNEIANVEFKDSSALKKSGIFLYASVLFGQWSGLILGREARRFTTRVHISLKNGSSYWKFTETIDLGTRNLVKKMIKH